ncbi:hypothetical protein [uncultured Draconibacterium sp.]|uniref:hypothetical protein n=1 Tax=uncultured Draconibacterium sp. TaxID=1573823 RepID=UPI003260FE32
MMRVLLIFTLLIFLWIGKSIANEHRGVFFKSKEVSLENRTGLDLTCKGAINYSNSFSIEFDILFRDLDERYGYVLQLKEKKGGHQFDLIYNIDGRFPDLFIVLDKKETNLQMALTREQIELVNRWHKLKLEFNAVSGEVAMTFEGKTVSDKIDLPASSELEWTFGIVNRYGFEIDEVPPMSVRNIRFSEQNNLKYFWPLDYTGDFTVKDSVDGKKAEIINPAWVVEQHHNWQSVKSFEFAEMPQVAFNRQTETFYFVQRKNGLTRFNLNTRKVSTVNYKAGNPFYEDAQQVFFDKDNRLRSYSKYKSLAPEFNEEKGRWNNTFDTLAYLPKYWHHNSLLHPADGSFTAIGGYGFFTYFNTIRKLNDDTKRWEELNFKGELFEPRYLAALGKSKTDSNSFYLFGGLGNASGKQILGKEFYYDLYQINFEQDSIIKKWELDEIDGESYTPVNSLIVDEENDCFYTLCFSHSNNETALQLLKAKLSEADCKFIGSKIPYIFYDITSFADLYNWVTHNKLLALTMHRLSNGRFRVNIYSLNYPPSEIDLRAKAKKTAYTFDSLLLFYGALLVLAVLLTVLILLKRNREKSAPKTPAVKLQIDTPLVDEKMQGGVYTFGGFQVFDRKGKDITYRFSPTLKELFLLIVLNTLYGNKGISSKKIQEYLWPDKAEHKAKNNRGVNIKKLRSILEDVGDITISFDGNYWRINHGDEVFCDIEFIKKYNESGFDINQPVEFAKVLTILKRGNFLLNTDAEWLDMLKDEISGKVVGRLEDVCSLLDMRKNEHELMEIAEVLFSFDQMNEKALQLKCYILNQQGKHSLALEVYNHYIRLYKKLYNEDFNRSFKALLSGQL